MSALPGFEEEGDNCCQCNAAAIHKVLRQEHIEIVHASFSNLIKDAAFFVALDHDYRKIVVSIRGTMSLEDVITDLIAEPEKFPEEVSQGREWYAHKGILEAAQALKSHVEEIFAILPDEVIESYGLLFVGHSLGAGTAAVLAILLKNEYPSSECYAYAPPGGLLSEQCVNDTKSFITTVVYGKDLVPRIGLAQLESLRAKMMRVMKNTNQPKWCIIGGGLLCCCRRSSADQEVDDAIEEEQNDKLRLNPSNTSLPPSSSRPLYPPGRIVHIVRSPQNSTKGKSNEKNAFMAVETDNVEHYNELIISRTMATDHLPFNMKNAMEKTVEFASHRSDLKPAGRSSILTRRDELASEDPSKANRLSVLAPSDDLSWDCANSVEVRFRDSLRQARETRHMNGGHGTQPMRTTRIRPPPQTLALRSGYFDPYIGRAPLATPETLSETSSLSSLTTPAGSIHHRLSAVFSPLMEPITQSPRPQYVSNGAVATTSDSAIGSMAPCSDDSSPPLASTRMEARRGPPKPPRLFLEPQSADDPDGEFVLWCASADDNDSDVERELVTTPYKLTFENGSLGSTGEDEMALDNYQIHCPLNEDDCNQEEYDPHRPYSHGAIGYQPLRLLLPHENGISRMKRSAEMDLSAIPEQVSLTYADEQSP